MRFEWDSEKNDENIRKHGLDYSDAHRVFDGPMFTLIDDRFEYGEVRNVGVGFLAGLVVVLVFAEKDDDMIRIISFRRGIRHERQQFYKYLKDRLGTSEDDV
jgi:uncharacterized DUF497 family protein